VNVVVADAVSPTQFLSLLETHASVPVVAMVTGLLLNKEFVFKKINSRYSFFYLLHK